MIPLAGCKSLHRWVQGLGSVGQLSGILRSSGPVLDVLQNLPQQQSWGYNDPFWVQQRGLKGERLRAKELPKLRFYDPVEMPEFDTFASPPTNYVQLLEAIKHRRSFKKQEELIEDYTSRYHAAHVAAAGEELVRLLELDQAALKKKCRANWQVKAVQYKRFLRHMQRLEILVKLNLARFHPDAAASMIFSLGCLYKLRLRSETQLDTAELLVSQLRSDGFKLLMGLGSADDVSKLAFGMAVLCPHHLDVREVLSRMCTQHLTWDDRATAQHLVRLARGMAMWGVRDPLLFDTIANHALVVHKWFTPEDTALMFWSFAKQRHVRRDMLDALASGIEPQLVLLEPLRLTLLLKACLRLGYNPPALIELLADKALRLLAQFRPRTSSRMLEALALLGAGQHRIFTVTLFNTAYQRRLALPPSVIARVAHALALADLTHLPAAQRLMRRFQKGLTRRAHLARPPHIATTYRAFSLSQVKAPEALEALNERALQLLPSFSVPHLTQWLSSALRLGPMPLMTVLAAGEHFKTRLVKDDRAAASSLVELCAVISRANVGVGNSDPELVGALLARLAETQKPLPRSRLGSMCLAAAQQKHPQLQQIMAEAQDRLVGAGQAAALRALEPSQVAALAHASVLANVSDERWVRPLAELLVGLTQQAQSGPQQLPASDSLVFGDLQDATKKLAERYSWMVPALAEYAAVQGLVVSSRAPAPPPPRQVTSAQAPPPKSS